MTYRDIFANEMKELSRKRQPGILATWKRWPRFKGYELKDSDRPSPDGGQYLYVSPVKGEELEFYDPFEHFPRILLDYLALAASIRYRKGETQDEHKRRGGSRILEFCNKYGLPGQFWFYIRWYDTSNDRLFVDPDWTSPYFPAGLIHYKKYAECFFPEQLVPDFLDVLSFPDPVLTKSYLPWEDNFKRER